jgi:hypothetical protein
MHWFCRVFQETGEFSSGTVLAGYYGEGARKLLRGPTTSPQQQRQQRLRMSHGTGTFAPTQSGRMDEVILTCKSGNSPWPSPQPGHIALPLASGSDRLSHRFGSLHRDCCNVKRLKCKQIGRRSGIQDAHPGWRVLRVNAVLRLTSLRGIVLQRRYTVRVSPVKAT